MLRQYLPEKRPLPVGFPLVFLLRSTTHTLISLFLIGGLAVSQPVLAKDTSSEVPKDIAALIKEIEGLEGKLKGLSDDQKEHKQLTTKLSSLRAILRSLSKPSETQLLEDMESKQTALQEQIDTIKDHPALLTEKNDKIKNLLKLLATITEKTTYIDPVETLKALKIATQKVMTERANEMGWPNYFINPTTEFRTAARTLAKTATTGWSPHTAAEFIHYAEQLATLLDEPAAIEAAKSNAKKTEAEVKFEFQTLRKDIGNSKKAIELRDKLQPLLTALKSEVSNRIFIVSAKAGDMVSAKKSRECSATIALRKECQGNEKCGPASATDVEVENGKFAIKKMCGYDPVELAPLEHKELWIAYTCLPPDSEEWEELLRHSFDYDIRHARFFVDRLGQSNILQAKYNLGSLWELRCHPKVKEGS
ncbi:MAG: hypothetical protein OIF58_16165 [Cohaesibacter sp.]|nr:hypothetical protein [Cohaesibacter sp.]